MANPSSFSITVNDLGKRFNREWIFKKLSFTFEKNQVYAVTGPNGSGKSTLLQTLWGQLPPTTGGLHYSKNGATIPVEEVYKHISIATPYLDLIDEFTLRETIRFHFKVREIRNGFTMDALPEIMYLADASDKPVGNFSSGMKQRLKLGLAFYTHAEVLFLDEPGTNLDDKAFGWYQEQLKSMSDTMIIIASNQAAEYPSNSIKIHLPEFK